MSFTNFRGVGILSPCMIGCTSQPMSFVRVRAPAVVVLQRSGTRQTRRALLRARVDVDTRRFIIVGTGPSGGLDGLVLARVERPPSFRAPCTRGEPRHDGLRRRAGSRRSLGPLSFRRKRPRPSASRAWRRPDASRMRYSAVSALGTRQDAASPVDAPNHAVSVAHPTCPAVARVCWP